MPGSSRVTSSSDVLSRPVRLGLLAPEHQEAGHVVRQVLDVAAQDHQVVEPGRHLGRRRRRRARRRAPAARRRRSSATRRASRAAGASPASAGTGRRRRGSSRRARSRSASTPARASRHMWISSAISALILRSLSRKVSKRMDDHRPRSCSRRGRRRSRRCRARPPRTRPGSSRSASRAPTGRTAA